MAVFLPQQKWLGEEEAGRVRVQLEGFQPSVSSWHLAGKLVFGDYLGVGSWGQMVPPRPRRQTSNYRGAVCVLGDSHPSYPQRQQKEGRVGSAMNEEACPTPSHEHHQDECLFWKDGGHTQITWKG